MTKLEKYIQQNPSNVHTPLCSIAHYINERKHCIRYGCDSCKYASQKLVFDVLLTEHKEPIKLKQWEKELLKIHYNYADNSRYFSNWNVLHKMKINGHFKGVSDTSMTPEKILENCEVVDDD